MSERLRAIFRALWPPLISFAVFLFLWDALVVRFNIQPFQVPRPVLVAEAFRENMRGILHGTWLTARAALVGFGAAIIVGCLTAFVLSQSRIIQRALWPYAIFLQTVPIVAIAPLIVLWFGSNFTSVVVTATIVSLFPIILNTTTGLTELDRNAVELFRLHNAGPLQLLFKLRLPSAIPYVIAGARTSSGLCVIGAIIGEFFAGYGGKNFGLGYIIYASNSQLRIDLMFAATFMATVLGLVIFGIIGLIGDLLLLRWRSK